MVTSWSTLARKRRMTCKNFSDLTTKISRSWERGNVCINVSRQFVWTNRSHRHLPVPVLLPIFRQNTSPTMSRKFDESFSVAQKKLCGSKCVRKEHGVSMEVTQSGVNGCYRSSDENCIPLGHRIPHTMLCQFIALALTKYIYRNCQRYV